MTPQDAFRTVYREHYSQVIRYAARRGFDGDAADLAAEVFLIAWRHWEEVPDKDPLPWLYAAARRVLANHRRGLARRRSLADRVALQDSVAVPDHGPEVVEHLGVVEAWWSLREADREVLALVGWDGLGARQAARALGCSTATFAVRLFRARGRLEAALAHGPGPADPEPGDKELKERTCN